MLKVGIAGGAGFTAGELIRLLVNLLAVGGSLTSRIALAIEARRGGWRKH